MGRRRGSSSSFVPGTDVRWLREARRRGPIVRLARSLRSLLLGAALWAGWLYRLLSTPFTLIVRWSVIAVLTVPCCLVLVCAGRPRSAWGLVKAVSMLPHDFRERLTRPRTELRERLKTLFTAGSSWNRP